MAETEFFELPGGRRIAHRLVEGAGPAVVFLPGYLSDMAGGKATAVAEWARMHGRACLLLDYSGCGESSGAFADGTLSRWRAEVLALIEAKVWGPVVLVGSSMGGWLALLVALELGERVAGLVGVAAAPDFTDWGYSDEQKALLQADQPVFEDNPYGPEPTPTYPGFWADGETLKLLGAEIAIDCPVRLLHGANDFDVPWDIALKLAAVLRSPDVQLTLVKDGDHRLSRDHDIALLLRTIAALT